MYRPIIFVIIVLCLPARFCLAEPQVLFDFNRGFDISSVSASDAEVSLEKGALCVKTGTEKTWPGITLKAPDGKWDLVGFQELTLDVCNLDDYSVTVNCRVDNTEQTC